jgi:hypothetical protein
VHAYLELRRQLSGVKLYGNPDTLLFKISGPGVDTVEINVEVAYIVFINYSL